MNSCELLFSFNSCNSCTPSDAAGREWQIEPRKSPKILKTWKESVSFSQGRCLLANPEAGPSAMMGSSRPSSLMQPGQTGGRLLNRRFLHIPSPTNLKPLNPKFSLGRLPAQVAQRAWSDVFPTIWFNGLRAVGTRALSAAWASPFQTRAICGARRVQ